ncbi:restriction endonuclease subunit S [Levilactobacillus brevis]|uniref:restriction endonuclease subunit S n=2 Tax=Lactobacillales TaxID=186826 RepID=UPI0021A90B80|nr:restriction endonuclease subunit S [Levilactobacillus brevis]MCT3580541.1 restriction endonuclease subunit S [Levilactobacillus brevis]
MSNKVPQLRFNGYSDAWEQRKLGKVFKTYSGMTPLRSDISNFRNPEVPWIKTTDLKNSDITSNDEKISAKAANKLKVLPVNTVLIAMYGGFNQIGRTGLLTYPATINQALTALEPNDSISPYFLLTELNYRVNDWKKFAASSRKDPNITKRDIDNFMINFPTQQEQQKLGEFFTSIDNLIAANQRKLDLLKEQKKGYLQKMFPKNGAKVPELRFAGFADDWEERKLGEISRMYQPLTITGNDLLPDGVPVFGANGFIGFFSEANHIDDQVTISARGEGTGTPSYVHGPVWITGNSMVVNVGDFDIDKYFLFANLTANSLKKYVTGGAQPQLTRDVLVKVPITLPNTDEQKKIGAFFKQLDDTITLHQRKLDLLKEQKKGFLQNMFVQGL